jgi:hypothetical protein
MAVNKRSTKTSAIQRIAVSHLHNCKDYRGALGDIIAAGLAKANQCPSVQGDPSAIKYKLEGSEVECSLQDMGSGPEYWVRVTNPQPPTCQYVLQKLGDEASLDEIYCHNILPYLALQNYALEYPNLTTTIETNSCFLTAMVKHLHGDLIRAKSLYSNNKKYQNELAPAIEAAERLMGFCDLISNDIDKADVGVLLEAYIYKIGRHMARAGACVNTGYADDYAQALINEDMPEEELAAA